MPYYATIIFIFDSKYFEPLIYRDWASKISILDLSQYDKHLKDDEIRNAALDAVIDILDKIRNIPDNSMAYVEKNYYNNFFER